MNKKIILWCVLMFLPLQLAAVGTDAGSKVINGGDSTVQDVSADTFGNLVMEYFSEVSSTDTQYSNADSQTIVVDTGYDLSVIADYDTINVAIKGDTKWIVYTVTNNSNAVDTVTLQLTYLEGNNWDSSIIYDEDGDGTNDPEDSRVVTGIQLAEDASGTFFVAIYIPTGANDMDTVKYTLTASDNVGAAGDSWPSLSTNSRDYQTDTAIVRVYGPVMYVKKDVYDTYGDKPYDTLTYVITYDNDGSGTSYNAVIYDVLPQYTSWVVGSIDSGLHSGTATIEFDTTYSGDFSDPEDTNVARIKITLWDPIGPDDGDNKGTAEPGGSDAGYIRFQVTVN